MSRARAAVGTVVFLFLAPGVVAGVIPWLLTRWEVDRTLWLPLRLAGGVVVAISVGVLLHAFALCGRRHRNARARRTH